MGLISMYDTDYLELSRLLNHIKDAYAPNTLRAYKADMEEFIAFCAKHDSNALPATPETIANFLMSTTHQVIKSSTIRRKVASISAVHRLSNLGDPTKHPEVKLCLRKIHRQLGNRFDQAYPVTRPILDQLLQVCGQDLRGIRNRALLLFAYDSMRRRSEIVSLRAEDIDYRADGGISILLRKSKTDQLGTGCWIHLGAESSAATEEWLKAASIEDGFLFRSISQLGKCNTALGEGQVGRIFKALAHKAKLEKHIVESISSHSMRVGSAQDLLIQGATLPQIMVKGGWAKTDTVMRYIERIRVPIFSQQL